jgi:hypothetical protein
MENTATDIDYESIIKQYQAENESLREQVAAVKTSGYYWLIEIADAIKHALTHVDRASFFMGYFVAVIVTAIGGLIWGD